VDKLLQRGLLLLFLPAVISFDRTSVIYDHKYGFTIPIFAHGTGSMSMMYVFIRFVMTLLLSLTDLWIYANYFSAMCFSHNGVCTSISYLRFLLFERIFSLRSLIIVEVAVGSSCSAPSVYVVGKYVLGLVKEQATTDNGMHRNQRIVTITRFTRLLQPPHTPICCVCHFPAR
jgi:hypothetical protein